MKAKAWYIKFPCDVYALGPVRFPVEVGERDVREHARMLEGCTRLPRGFQCWVTDD